MSRLVQGLSIVLGSLAASAAVLANAVAWGPHHCKAAFPMVIGCALGSYESLAGGMIAAGAAVFAGWLAWSAVQVQVAAEDNRAAADRVEVDKVLQDDLDYLAEGLGAIWKILEGFDEAGDLQANRTKLEGVIYGIEAITKKDWLSTSRKMVTVLGWERRRSYERLFEALEQLGRFRTVDDFDVDMATSATRSVAYDLVGLRSDTDQYFEGRFWRGGKAWTLGYTIERYAGIAEP